MFEVQKIIADILGILRIPDAFHFLVPHVGVGGGVEAKEHVSLLPLLQYTLIFVAGIGTLFGIGLASEKNGDTSRAMESYKSAAVVAESEGMQALYEKAHLREAALATPPPPSE